MYAALRIMGTLWFLSLIVPLLYGQATTKGNISGIIEDPSGALVGGASVTMRNSSRGIERTTMTNERGFYSFQLVDVGEYSIEVRSAGFKTQIRDGIRVETQEAAVANFVLEVGDVTQRVVVSGREEVVEAATSELGGVVEEKKVLALPQNTRTWTNLARLEPGTVDNEILTAQSGPTTGGGAFAQGMRVFFNNMTVDGVDLNDPFFPGSAVITRFTGGTVSNEAIQDFNVVTGNAGANFGVNLGAQIGITTKSGTNELHGTLFEFLRNSKLDARNFFDGPEPPPFKLNQFGFSLGGPIRKNKTFFFGNYEGYRQRKRETRLPVVPTPLLLSSIPGGSANGFLREVLEALYPRPEPGTFSPTDSVATVRSFADFNTNRNMFLVRIDHQLTLGQRLTGRYLFNDTPSGFGSAIGTGIPISDAGVNWRMQNLALLHTWTISASKVNEFRVGYNRLFIAATYPPAPQSLQSLGFGALANDPKGVPFIFPAGTGLSFVGQIPQVTFGRANNTFQLSDVYSHVHGSHNLKAGADVFRAQSNQFNDLFIRPQTVFFGFGPPFDNSPFGLTTATFFVQQQNFFQQPSLRGWRYTQFGLYFTDRYEVHKDLTLNYGVRYEFMTPVGEARGLLNNLFQVDSSGNPLPDKAITDFSRTALFPACCGAGRNFYKSSKRNFGPRVGIAWKMFGNPKTVLRTGYSLLFGRLFLDAFANGALNPPFVIPTAIAGQRFGTIADPAVAGLTPSLSTIAPDFDSPYAQYWNLSIQRELDANTVLEVGYVGTRGVHLDYLRAPNFGPGFVGVRPNPNFADISFVESTATSSYNALEVEFKRRFSKGLTYQASYTWSKSIDDSSGTSRSVFAAVGVVTNFPMDQFNRRLNRGPSDFDFRHVLTFNYVYDLPFGPGRKFLSGTRGFTEKLLQGWTVSGLTTIRSGQAFSLATGTDTNQDGVASDRPTIIGSPDRIRTPGGGKEGNTQFLDASLVGTVILDDPSSPSGRNILTGPITSIWDFSLAKTTTINERYRFEFRTEFFNLPNHTNLGLPDNVISSPFFGRILSTSQPSRQIQFALKFEF